VGLPDRLALDTNCFIYAFDGAGTDRADFVVERLLQGGPRWTSSLVLAELLAQPYAIEEPDRAAALRRALEALPGLTIVPVSSDIAQEAARLRGSLGLSLPDAIVLATALAAGAVLVTNDRRFCEAAGRDAALMDDLLASET